jgi:hypothetical protein
LDETSGLLFPVDYTQSERDECIQFDKDRAKAIAEEYEEEPPNEELHKSEFFTKHAAAAKRRRGPRPPQMDLSHLWPVVRRRLGL